MSVCVQARAENGEREREKNDGQRGGGTCEQTNTQEDHTASSTEQLTDSHPASWATASREGLCHKFAIRICQSKARHVTQSSLSTGPDYVAVALLVLLPLIFFEMLWVVDMCLWLKNG